MQQGGLIPMGVAVGDKVLLPEYGGQAITLDGDDYHLFREDDILVSAISCRHLPLRVHACAPQRVHACDPATTPYDLTCACALLRA